MKHHITAIAAIAALTLAACGGGSDEAGSADAGESDDAAQSEEAPEAGNFAAPAIASAEICTAVPGEQFVPVVLDSTGVFDTPSESQIGCSFQFFNTETSVLDAQVMVENEGGQAGYDAHVADWSSRGEATEVPGLGDAATLVENGSVRRMIALDGDRVIVVNGPSRDSFPFTVDVATAMMTAAVAAL